MENIKFMSVNKHSKNNWLVVCNSNMFYFPYIGNNKLWRDVPWEYPWDHHGRGCMVSSWRNIIKFHHPAGDQGHEEIGDSLGDIGFWCVSQNPRYPFFVHIKIAGIYGCE